VRLGRRPDSPRSPSCPKRPIGKTPRAPSAFVFAGIHQSEPALHHVPQGAKDGHQTGIASPVYENQADYLVLSGEWEIGRIYAVIGGPPEYKWFWSLALNGPIGKRSDRVASRGRSQGAAPAGSGAMEGLGGVGGTARAEAVTTQILQIERRA
jgi:hypothetical protein